MSRLLSKLSNNKLTFGQSSKSRKPSIESNKENSFDFVEKAKRRKRSSLFKTVTDSFRKKKLRASECDNGETTCLAQDNDRRGSLVDSRRSSNVFIRNKVQGKTVPVLKRITTENLSGSPKLAVGKSSIRRSQRCENLSLLSAKSLESDGLLSPHQSENVSKHKTSLNTITNTTQIKKRNLNHEVSESNTIEQYTNGQQNEVQSQDMKNNKRKLQDAFQKDGNSTNKEANAPYVLPAVKPFRPEKSSRGRIATEDRHSVWAKHYSAQRGRSPNVSRHSYSFVSQDSSITMSPVRKLRRVEAPLSLTPVINGGKGKRPMPENWAQKDGPSDRIKLLTESLPVSSEKEKSVMNKDTKVVDTLARDKSSPCSGVNDDGVSKMSAITVSSSITGNNLSESQTEACFIDDTGRANISTSHKVSQGTVDTNNTADFNEHKEVNELDQSSCTDLDSENSMDSIKNVHNNQEQNVAHTPEEVATHAKFPFLSPKQIEYIFNVDADGTPMSRSQSVCNVSTDQIVHDNLQNNSRRNSLSEVDKYNRYISFLESKKSPNKTTSEVYVGEVMTELIQESMVKIRHWKSTPNTKYCRDARSMSESHSISYLPMDITNEGIAGKKTSDLYPKKEERPSYFASIY